MDLIEFSIACKLISCKLRNVEVPKLLPPTLIASLKHIGTPIRTPTGAMSPVEGYKQFLPQVVPMQMPVASVPAAVITQQQQHYQQPIAVQPVIQPAMVQAPVMISPQAVPLQQQQQYIPQEMIAQPMMMPQTQPMMMPQTQPIQMMVQPQQMVSQPQPATIVPSIEQFNNAPLLESLVQVQPSVIPTGTLPAAPTPTPPQSGQASRSMSFSEKAPNVLESP